MTLLFSETTLPSTSADINNSSWQNTLPGRLNVTEQQSHLSRVQAAVCGKWKCNLSSFKWAGTKNVHWTACPVSGLRRSMCHFRQTHAGCERHREDLAKPWPGYPASPSTQCARGTQIGTPPTQVQGKCSHAVALSFPKPAPPSTMAARSFMFMSYPDGDTHIH